MSDWTISRDLNMSRANVLFNLLHPESWSLKKNPAATPSALADWGFLIGKELSNIGEALINAQISWQEACTLVLAKRGIGEAESAVKPFIVLMKVMSKLLSNHESARLTSRGFARLTSISSYEQITDSFCTCINDAAHEGEGPLSKYQDIWFNALQETGLFLRNDDSLEFIIANKNVSFADQVSKYGDLISRCPSKHGSGNNYYFYMGALDTGLPEIFDAMEPDVVRYFFPHLIKETHEEKVLNIISENQLITYGAPGTGKSHKVKDEYTAGMKKENVFRTTFHPDSDYSTFVGAYKPTTSESRQVILDYESLVDKFKEYLSVQPANVTRSCALFGNDYHDSILDMQEHGRTIPDLVNDAYKSGTTYDSIVRAGMSVYEQSPSRDGNISYSFIPQAFVNAYVKAWQTTDKVALVIEEINRGNCAQIFGDLFQLLDRSDGGWSDYAVDADADLAQYLGGVFAKKFEAREGIPDDVTEEEVKCAAIGADGRVRGRLVLPPNLYIYATMNTSDQSLFPIDSAFKRRWEWEYVPIEDAGKGWKIDVGGAKYKWWSFLEKINAVIATETNSEDKQLGYFFVKAKGDEIDAKTFVSKVIFYLWGDVFKDNLPDVKAFQYTFKKDGKDDKRLIGFADFYHPETGNTKEQWRDKLLTSFLDALEVDKGTPPDNESGQGSSTIDGGVAKVGE